jgi:hypothetical protein
MTQRIRLIFSPTFLQRNLYLRDDEARADKQPSVFAFCITATRQHTNTHTQQNCSATSTITLFFQLLVSTISRHKTMADNEEELVDYDEEEVRSRNVNDNEKHPIMLTSQSTDGLGSSHHHHRSMVMRMDPLESRITNYISSNQKL